MSPATAFSRAVWWLRVIKSLRHASLFIWLVSSASAPSLVFALEQETIDDAAIEPIECKKLPGDGNCVVPACGCSMGPGHPCHDFGCNFPTPEPPPPATGPGGGPGVENCNSPGDEDSDGLINCEDPDCHTPLQVTATVNGTDHIETLTDDMFLLRAAASGGCQDSANVYSYSWDIGDGTLPFETPNVNVLYRNPGFYPISIDVTCLTCLDTTPVQLVFDAIAFNVSITKPSGDPVLAGSDKNEFVLKGADQSTEINVEAKIEPALATSLVSPRLHWRFRRGAKVGPPPGSHLTWSRRTSDRLVGEGEETKLTIFALPTKSESFGNYEIELSVVDATGTIRRKQSQPIELFYARDETPHGVPNWFYYWLDATGRSEKTTYGGVTPDGRMAHVDAGANFSYFVAQDPNAVTFFGAQPGTTDGFPHWAPGSVCAVADVFGIDAFFSVLKHEEHHIKQNEVCNSFLWSSVGPLATEQMYANGWALSQPLVTLNHYSLGPDGAPGIAGVDDNFDGVVDDLDPDNSSFELGQGDDIALYDPIDPRRNWCLGLGPVPPPLDANGGWLLGKPDEQDACGAQDTVDDKHFQLDWGAPGKQHRERYYND